MRKIKAMKKIKTIALLTTISLSLLTACSKKDESTSQNTHPASAVQSDLAEKSNETAQNPASTTSSEVLVTPDEDENRPTKPHYQGTPKTDPKFAQFLKKNNGKVVQLDLLIEDPDDFDFITSGYRGVSPTFDVAALGKTNYAVFIDCDQIDQPNSETTIGRCAPVVEWDMNTGHLSGQFKVENRGKNDLGDMLYFLIAVK